MQLLIECFIERMKLVLLSHAAFPPCIEEAAAVACELDEGRYGAEQAHLDTFVLPRRIYTYHQHIKKYRQKSQQRKGEVSAKNADGNAAQEQQTEHRNAQGECHRQQMNEF